MSLLTSSFVTEDFLPYGVSRVVVVVVCLTGVSVVVVIWDVCVVVRNVCVESYARDVCVVVVRDVVIIVVWVIVVSRITIIIIIVTIVVVVTIIIIVVWEAQKMRTWPMIYNMT